MAFSGIPACALGVGWVPIDNFEEGAVVVGFTWIEIRIQ